MIKIFSNNIISYLENDVNIFISKTKCHIINICYNSFVVDGELLHSILLYYTIPME